VVYFTKPRVYFSSPKTPYIAGAYTLPYSVDKGADFTRMKRPGRGAIPTLYLVRLRMSGSITAWRVQGQIYILSVPDCIA
jgi:hypothetical protein